MPDFRLEISAAARCGKGAVAGVDEAGRGPLAGPVVAAAVILDRVRCPRRLRREVDDSKKLAREAREELFGILHRAAADGCVTIGVGIASVEEIDRINILQATFVAMQRAVAGLAAPPGVILVDGNLCPPFACRAEPVIGGDALSLSIAAASIVAKVTRDRIMVALAREHPGYGWETNVGYSTPEHYAGLARLGPNAHHRRSFAPVRNALTLLDIDAATRVTQDAAPWTETPSPAIGS